MRFDDGGVAASELVVEDHSTLVGERLVRFHVVPGGARAAMKAQQRQRVRRRGFPDGAIPGLVAGKVHVALGGLIAHLETLLADDRNTRQTISCSAGRPRNPK